MKGLSRRHRGSGRVAPFLSIIYQRPAVQLSLINLPPAWNLTPLAATLYLTVPDTYIVRATIPRKIITARCSYPGATFFFLPIAPVARAIARRRAFDSSSLLPTFLPPPSRHRYHKTFSTCPVNNICLLRPPRSFLEDVPPRAPRRNLLPRTAHN